MKDIYIWLLHALNYFNRNFKLLKERERIWLPFYLRSFSQAKHCSKGFTLREDATNLLHLETLERLANNNNNNNLPKFKGRSERDRSDTGSHHGKNLPNDEPERCVWTDKNNIMHSQKKKTRLMMKRKLVKALIIAPICK